MCKFGPKTSMQNALLRMKIHTKSIQRYWFRIPQLFSLVLSLNYLFWVNLVSKLQSALFRIKLSTKGYSGVQILNSTVVFSNSTPKILLLGKIWCQNFKVLYLQWILVQRDIQGCWLWSIQKVVGISTSEHLFIHIFILNKPPMWRSRTKSPQKSYCRDEI